MSFEEESFTVDRPSSLAGKCMLCIHEEMSWQNVMVG